MEADAPAAGDLEEAEEAEEAEEDVPAVGAQEASKHRSQSVIES